MKVFKHSSIILFIFFSFGTLLLQGCSNNNTNRFRFNPKAAPPPYDQSQAVRDTTLSGGIKIYVIKEGTGPYKVTPNDQIQVKYTGRTANGKVFTTTYTKNSITSNSTNITDLYPYPERNSSPLVEGLRRGLLGMQEGEKRIIRVPPSMGYTSSGTSIHGVNVYNKTLVYDVQLVKIY